MGTPLRAGFYEDLEELLVAGDLGPALAGSIAAGVRRRQPRSLEEARGFLEAEVVLSLWPGSRRLRLEASPSCILLYGINGSGKTTTVGKLAWMLRSQGRNPLVVAADTYRAAGLEQAVLWAQRAGVASFAGRAGGDSAAAVFDGLNMAASRGHDVVIVDTAGRLQTQHNLLQELAKIGRVAGRAVEGAPHESLLVLDAVLGQSSLAQAAGFNKALPISGLVLAKLDGTAKGGAVLAIESALQAPVKLAGMGEGIEDLAVFEPHAYARSLFDGAA
jgi:fused signal recognition particle receptor